ncbi:hypothetical protein AB4Z50_21280 [Paenibacillus sp. 2TAB26]|uniref:hypothetical protein n=1 Tax=Paenibacillus sp. 2TAB26 TaxID=3233005 RepID=UPI003F9B7F5F
MNAVELEKFAKQYNSFEKAHEGFWVYVNSWFSDEPKEFVEAFNSNDISTSTKLSNERIALVINYRWDDPIYFVQTTLNVEINEREIAQYHLLQTLDGEDMDDGLSFSNVCFVPRNID